MLPDLDEQIAGLEKLLASRRGFQLGSFLLFVDFYLIAQFNINLVLLDLDWVKQYLGIGGVATIAFMFFLFAGLLVPWVHIFFLLPSVIGSEILIYKWSEKEGAYVRGVRKSELLNFAIMEGNDIAYQEYQGHARSAAEHIKDIRWIFVFLFALGLDAFASRGAPESLLELLWISLQRLPAWIFYSSVAAIAVTLLILVLSSIVTLRFARNYYAVSPRLYQMIKASMLAEKTEQSDSEEVEEA